MDVSFCIQELLKKILVPYIVILRLNADMFSHDPSHPLRASLLSRPFQLLYFNLVRQIALYRCFCCSRDRFLTAFSNQNISIPCLDNKTIVNMKGPYFVNLT